MSCGHSTYGSTLNAVRATCKTPKPLDLDGPRLVSPSARAMRIVGYSFGPTRRTFTSYYLGGLPSHSPLSLVSNYTALTGNQIIRHSSTSTSPAAVVLPQSPSQRKTVYALATPPGKSGVAIVRISGPDVSDVYFRMVRRPIRSGKHVDRGLDSHKGLPLPRPRYMERCSVMDARSGEHLDDGLAVYFRGREGLNIPVYLAHYSPSPHPPCLSPLQVQNHLPAKTF